MKKVYVMLLIIAAVVFSGCRPVVKPGPPPVKIISIGDSITMGTQDAGLKEDFQKHNYPYLIAKQVGNATIFQQPYLKTYSDGIGTPPYKKPLTLSGGTISASYWNETELANPKLMEEYILDQFNPFSLILQRPYDNLGINGARLINIRTTERSTEPQAMGNYFFDIVLRNLLHDSEPLVPELGNVVEQAAIRNPDYILLWIGNNDILHVVLNGAGLNGSDFEDGASDPPLPIEDFGDEYELLLDSLLAVTDGIVLASIPDYLPFVYALDGAVRDGNLCIFHPETFVPYNFAEDPDELFIPLMLEESGAPHLLLSGVIMYMDLEEQGYSLGIPDKPALTTTYGFSSEEADSIIAQIETLGLTPSGLPLPGICTLTGEEESDAMSYINGYNTIISGLSTTKGLPLVDITSAWWREGDFDDYSMDYALQDQEKTAFSLDGVHPNNLGQALCAHAFIEVLNDEYMLGIPQIDPDQYAGQYSGKSIEARGLKALQKLEEF